MCDCMNESHGPVYLAKKSSITLRIHVCKTYACREQNGISSGSECLRERRMLGYRILDPHRGSSSNWIIFFHFFFFFFREKSPNSRATIRYAPRAAHACVCTWSLAILINYIARMHHSRARVRASTRKIRTLIIIIHYSYIIV